MFVRILACDLMKGDMIIFDDHFADGTPAPMLEFVLTAQYDESSAMTRIHYVSYAQGRVPEMRNCRLLGTQMLKVFRGT
jgi:hypothetical protein